MRRSRRFEELSEIQKERLLEALGTVRKAVIEAHTVLKPASRTYVLGSAITESIDDLVEHLTGRRDRFWAQPHARSGNPEKA